MNANLGDCRLSGSDRRSELACWAIEGWLLGDGRIVPPTEVQDVRGRGTHDLDDPWIAHVFGTSVGFIPLKVIGHGPAGWLTDKGPFTAICEPVPVSPKGKPLRDAAGKPLRFYATDIYEQALNPHYDYNHPGPGPGDCFVIGYRGGFWETATGDLLLPQDTRFWKSTRKQPFSLASPIRCLGGTTAMGSDADHLWVTDSGPSHYLEGPIPPGSPASEERIQDLLARTPNTLLHDLHRRTVFRHAGVKVEKARKTCRSSSGSARSARSCAGSWASPPRMSR